ncbi:hypothetical protein ACHAWO_009588 [Cyclotella atomus]|uniref:Uncharacterized protein n=1 Tax=Cyclotella atomus TaxID=382360 RepID=A0ABD3MLY5_9STRA
MKFTAALIAASMATTTAFAPAAPNARCTTSLSETVYKMVGEASPAAKDKADDLAKTIEVIMDYFEKEESTDGIDDSDDDTPYVPPTPPPAPAAAAPAAKSSTGIELWSVDYDAAAMLAYKAAGSKGDFGAFKTKYLADTSAMVGEKNPYKK